MAVSWGMEFVHERNFEFGLLGQEHRPGPASQPLDLTESAGPISVNSSLTISVLRPVCPRS